MSMHHNQAFIERMMNWGVKLVDYGIDATRDYRSFLLFDGNNCIKWI
ncbi:MAG: hypothetical protein L6U99_10515 [Clostridium sp.]|nr:MAG: hypothetical protein L6U99_10515 [Clostridium sp.]